MLHASIHVNIYVRKLIVYVVHILGVYSTWLSNEPHRIYVYDDMYEPFRDYPCIYVLLLVDPFDLVGRQESLVIDLSLMLCRLNLNPLIPMLVH